jgi:hypothetical protein
MNITRENKKLKAIELLKTLGIYAPYIEGFKENNEVCYFEYFGGYWASQNQELSLKIKEIEEKYNCIVYAITHDYTDFGECYSFLIITDYKEEWNYSLEKTENGFYAFAYVWNKDDDYCSEFGTIAIKSFGGGIKRIG